MIHTLAHDAMVFLCITDIESRRQAAFKFLDDMARRFYANYPQGSVIPEAWKIAVDLTPTIEALMADVNHRGEPSGGVASYGAINDCKVAQTKAALDELKGTMMDNIDKVIDRGE